MRHDMVAWHAAHGCMEALWAGALLRFWPHAEGSCRDIEGPCISYTELCLRACHIMCKLDHGAFRDVKAVLAQVDCGFDCLRCVASSAWVSPFVPRAKLLHL